MERNGSSKIVAVVALIVAVIGLGVGFAAFTSTLTISSSATVTPNANTFQVKYVTSGTLTNDLTCEVTSGATTGANIPSVDLTNAAITDTAITGIVANLVEPGDEITCTATIKNYSEYIAYLRSIESAAAITCSVATVESPLTPATDALVQTACADITATLTVASKSATATKTAAASNTTINNASLAAAASGQASVGGGSTEAKLVIKYADDGDRADGKFNVTIPMFTVTYKTVDAA